VEVMTLSATTIAPVACVLPPPGGVEKRRAPRFQHVSRAQLIFWPSTRRIAPIDVQVVDYSSTGVGIVHDEALLLGQTYVLREPLVTEGHTCMYTVARCDRRADGRFSIGLHICNTLEDALEPREEHVPPPGQWMRFFFFLGALAGAIMIVSYALFRYLYRH